jgi:hypothetical protein
MTNTLTESPTAPKPKIATVEPFFGFATLTVAPKPKQMEKIKMNFRYWFETPKEKAAES